MMIGRYKLLEKIGEGGFGTVYVAEQRESLKRRVALKIIKLGMDTKQVIARFEAERQALALMDHPNIAKVLDAAATDTGRPYFVMELVRGIKITDYCDQNNLSTRQRLDLFINVCQAIQHAHQKGIIHRDIKPSNVLVTLHDGVPVPKVIDFGIAKATQGELTEKTVYTQLQEFIGTPAYMSPEQAEMSGLDIDTRADIYSLGVLLYELLTGKTPFDAKDLLASGLEQMRRTIREKEPVRPSTRLTQELTSKSEGRKHKGETDEASSRRLLHVRKLIELLRGDLDWIVMKCLEKERTRRYDTANSLASDVQRYLDTEPVAARPASQWYRFQKLVRRNKLAFGAASAVAGALIIGLGLSTWLFVQERGTRLRAETAEREQAGQRRQAEAARASELRMRQKAEEQALATRKKAYASDMNLLQKALADDDLGRAQILLDKQRPRNGEQDLRGWEWRYFWQFCRSDAAFTLCQQSNSVTSVSFSRQGDLLAVGTLAGETTVWDIPSRRLIFQRPAGSGGAGRLAFAPEGDLLAYYDGSTSNKAIVLWDGHQRAEVRRLPVKHYPRDLAFTRDGRLFTVEISRSNSITAWDVATGAALFHRRAVIANHSMGKVFNISGDGSKCAYSIVQPLGSIRVEDLKLQAGLVVQVTDELTTALEFALDGQILATGAGYADGAIKLWDAQSQPLGSLEGHRSWVSGIKALPDGNTLASASADRTIRLWDLKTRHLIRTLRGQNTAFWSLDVSHDGRWLASGCKDGSVSLWDLASSTNRAPMYRTLQTNGVGRFAYSPDGRMIGLLRKGHLLLCQTTAPEQMTEPELALTNIESFVFAADSNRLAANDGSGHLRLWDIPGRRVITNFPIESEVLFYDKVAGSNRLWAVDHTGKLKEWEEATWTELHSFQLDRRGGSCGFSREAGLIITARFQGSFELFSLQAPENRRHFTGQGRISDAALARDGKVFAAASENGTVELWDTTTATRTALLHGVLHGYHSVTFSPDGERLAAGSVGQEAIKVWDLHSLEEVATLSGQGSMFVDSQFSPNGDTIAARNMNGVIHFWSAPSWPEIAAAERALQTATPR